jgi:hypothetical protein
MQELDRDICQAILNKDEAILNWIVAVLPFSGEEFCNRHAPKVLSNNATGYLANGYIDVSLALQDSLEKLSDKRLATSFEKFGEALVKVAPFKAPKTESVNPIVKKHVIAENQADLDKERQQNAEPIEIEVETPRGKSVFIENTSKHCLQNPAKIDIDEEASDADSMQAGGSDSHS